MFSDDDIALIHQVSRGLPRAVNNLAIQALVGAYATAKSVVDDSSALAAGSRHALPGVRPEDALLLNHEALSLGTLPERHRAVNRARTTSGRSSCSRCPRSAISPAGTSSALAVLRHSAASTR